VFMLSFVLLRVMLFLKSILCHDFIPCKLTRKLLQTERAFFRTQVTVNKSGIKIALLFELFVNFDLTGFFRA
jgi:hypothetical protein